MKSLKLIAALAALCLAPLAEAATSHIVSAPSTSTFTLRRASTNRQLLAGIADLNACVAEADRRGITRDYFCEATVRYTVSVTVTTDPVCPAKPADETRAGSCPAGTSGAWQQTRSYVSDPAACWVAGPWTPSSPPDGACVADPVDPPPPPPPSGATFTDLAKAPACATVTTYDAATRAVVSAGPPSAAGVPVIAGRCLEATPTNLGSVWASAQPGDVIHLADGLYNKLYGDNPWYNDSAFGTTRKGTEAQPIAVVGGPGALFKRVPGSGHGPFVLGTESTAANAAAWITYAGFSVEDPSDCFAGGGNTQAGSSAAETGATNIRIVHVSCKITALSDNTMTGAISVQGDGWYIRGNTLRDLPGRAIINNNHGIYIQNGADNVVVQDNDIQMRIGHVVQIHQDGTSMQYDNLLVKDNWIHGANYGDMRGIALINVKAASTLRIEGNRIEHQGQGGWGCVNVYFGNVTIDGLQCLDSQGGVQVNGQPQGSENTTRKVTITNSKICPAGGYPRFDAENGASLSQITETNPVACQ